MNKKDYKSILDFVAKDTMRKKKIKVKCAFGTKMDYYLSDLFRDVIKKSNNFESKLYELKLPFYSDGWYNSEENYLYVLLSNDDEKNNISRLIIFLLHELRHRFLSEYSGDFSLYESIMFHIEYLINDYDSAFYNVYHNKFIKEIDADMFALDYARDYMEDPNKFVDEETFEKYRRIAEVNLELYDDEFIFNEFLKIYVNNNFNKLYEDELEDGTFVDDRPVLFKILFNQFSNLHDFQFIYDELMKYRGRSKCHDDIIDLVLSTRKVLDKMDINELDDAEKEEMIRIINKALDGCLKRRKFIVNNNLRYVKNHKYLNDYSKDIQKSIFYKELLKQLSMSKGKKI